MKKTSKTIGALALSAALALGTAVPAFALGEYGTYDGGNDMVKKDDLKQNDSMATDVKIATMITNINVAVPLTITIVADSAGTDILAPNSGLKAYDASGNFPTDGSGITGYRIENYSTYPVAIKGIEVDDNSGGNWALVDAIAADNLTKTGKYGDLALTLTPADKKSATASSLLVNEGDVTEGNNVVNLFAAQSAKQEPGWVVDRQASSTEPAIMGLVIAGKNSALKNVNDDSVLLGSASDPKDPDPLKPDEAFKITYTVGAASTAA